MGDDVYFNAPRRRSKRQPPSQLVDKLLQEDLTDYCQKSSTDEEAETPSPLFKFCNHHPSSISVDVNSRSLLFVKRENVPLVVRCELNGVDVFALVDTTRAVTTVSMDIIEKLRLTFQMTPCPEYVFTPFTKTVVEAIGTLNDMDLTAGNFHQLIKCYVVGIQHPEVILGLDFMEETQAIIDFGSSSFFVGGNKGERLPFINVHDVMKLARISMSMYKNVNRCPSL